jgi:hypothetical protein
MDMRNSVNVYTIVIACELDTCFSSACLMTARDELVDQMK